MDSFSVSASSPLRIRFRAAGIFRRVVGGWRNGRNKLFKVHHVTEKRILRSGAFWVDRTRTMGSQLQAMHNMRKHYNPCTVRSELNRIKLFCLTTLTRCIRSKEKIWMLQVTVDRVQIMVERILRPQALKSRSYKNTTHTQSWFNLDFKHIPTEWITYCQIWARTDTQWHHGSKHKLFKVLSNAYIDRTKWKSTLSWWRTAWQSACWYSNSVSSSVGEHICLGSQQRHRPFSIWKTHTLFREKKRRQKRRKQKENN